MTARRARRRLATVALLAILAAAVAAGPAQAVHWPFFGGDNGRSGYQPIDEGTVPVAFLYAKNEPFIKTSIVTTTGNLATQRLAYGTRDGFVHLQILGTGAPVPATGEAGIQVDDGVADLDVFGTRSMVAGENGASVGFADTSGATGLGQLFAVHNDDDTAAGAPDIEIAQIDETTGARVRADVDVAGTDGFTIESSPVATGPAADGSRVLFFVARSATDPTDARLFRVPVTGDAATGASVVNGPGATNTGDIDATPLSSPAIVFRNDAMGQPAARVAVGTNPTLRLFAATNLTLVDQSANLGGPVQTPTVPIQPNGMTPSPAGPVTTAPFIYVASAVAGNDTAVHKLNNVASLTPATPSRTVNGAPAPALSTDQETEPSIAEAKLFVTTGENLYFLSTANLGEAGTFSPTTLAPGTTGFQQTTAATSGDFVYVTNDQAQQFVLRLGDGQSVSAAEFTPSSAATAALPNTGVGQPSLSRGFVQFAGGNGAFVYRAADANAPAVTLATPGEGATLTGAQTFSATASDTRGIRSVQFRLNGQPIGALDTAADAGSPFAPGAGATYSVAFDTATVPNGSYLIDALATDTSGLTTISAQRRVTIDNGPGQGVGGDDRPPTVTFTAPASNALVRSPTTVAATAADDRAIADVSFFVGDRAVCRDTTAPYACPATFTGADVGRNALFAVATDSRGQTGATVRIVRVDRFTPRGLTAKTTPSRDRRAPYVFRTRGSVLLPANVTRSQGCGEGTVSVQIKRGTATVSTRLLTLGRDCRYSSTLKLRDRTSLGRTGRLKVTTRFLGNTVLKPLSAKSRSVRAG